MAPNMTWKAILPNCFKTQKEALMPKNQDSKQNSLQRILISDFESSLSLTSDIYSSLVGWNLHTFTLAELKLITHNFSSSNFLGEGGFGPVHKGFVDEKIRPGLEAQPVAVKLLDLDGNQGHREWLAEVIFLGQLRHPHLVKLIGYCCEDEQRLLVYEYMARGNLENQLFRRFLISLPWLTRLKIAVGAAKGLAFLHGEEKPIIYRDFKASNILLDSDYTAKLSDFGLAKDGPEGDETHVTTRVMGTHGYAAPEYIMTGHLTNMSDVYSFGVVLLELITGRRAMDKSRPSREQSLVEWARPLLKDSQNTRLDRLMDPKLEGQYSIQGAKKAIAVANQCLSHHPKFRPTMIRVVNTLEPLLDLDDDVSVASFVYAIPKQGGKGSNDFGSKEGNESVENDHTHTEEEERGIEKKREKGRGHRQRKGHRHRQKLRSMRSRAVYSDTALYTTLKNSSNPPMLQGQEEADDFIN